MLVVNRGITHFYRGISRKREKILLGIASKLWSVAKLRHGLGHHGPKSCERVTLPVADR